jgi:tol-pal system protein YbgF
MRSINSEGRIPRVVVILLLVALLALSMGLGKVFAGEEEELYLKGNTFCMQSQWDRAIENFRNLVSRYPDTKYADARFWIGYCQVERGEYTEAVETFKSFVQKYPRDNYAAQALYKIGEVYEKYLNDYDKAVSAYNQVERQFPESSVAQQARFNNAYIQEFANQNFSVAQSKYKEVEKTSQSRKDVYPGYGEKAQQRIAFINQHSDNGYKPLRLYTQSLNLEEHGKPDKAIEGYGSLISKYPRCSLADDSAYRMIKCWESKGVVAKVAEECRKFLASYPDSDFVPQVRLLLKRYGG